VAFFNITSNAEFSGATVTFPDGTVQVIASDNKNYEAVKVGLLDGSLSDDQLLELIAPFEAIYKTLTKLSERVSRKGSKLLFDGDVVKNALTDFIIKIMNEGSDDAAWKAYIAFMEKLYTNPSETSKEHLFHFIEANGLQVTPDGDIVLYKGTKMDGKSTHAGYGIVNGVEFTNDFLQNSLGAVVEIPRGMVDKNRSVDCSVGLHVGAFEYVTGKYHGTWPRMWTVLVNPRDVVAVPHDFKSSKIRVTRYRVVEDNKDTVKHDGLVWSPADATPVAAPEAPAEPIAVEAAAPAQALAPADTEFPAGSRAPEYMKLISRGGAGQNLKRYRNKNVTAGRREDFDAAVAALGLQY